MMAMPLKSNAGKKKNKESNDLFFAGAEDGRIKINEAMNAKFTCMMVRSTGKLKVASIK
jgi:hypothetical protein